MEDDGIKNKAIQKNTGKRTSHTIKRLCTIGKATKKQFNQLKKKFFLRPLGNARKYNCRPFPLFFL